MSEPLGWKPPGPWTMVPFPRRADVSPFESGTGLMGGTEPGQRVTADNAHHLPPGSVVRLDDGARLIHLHDDVWLWCTEGAWCYDGLTRHLWRLPGTLDHLP